MVNNTPEAGFARPASRVGPGSAIRLRQRGGVTLRDNDWKLLLARVSDGLCTPFLGAGAVAHALPLASDIARRWAQSDGYPLAPRGHPGAVTARRSVARRASA